MQPPDPFDDRYTNLRLLGKGGFGVVYRAWDLEMEREVALKLLNPELAADPDWRKRFRQEATAASKLNHQNITIVFDRGEYQDRLYIVMELVDGDTLSRIIEQKLPLTDPERLLLIEQLCDGLHYAHQRNIVHRDIKPVNLIVHEEHDGTHLTRSLKILDFGIAKIIDSGQTATGAQMMFTPNYVSPEQIRGLHVDRRCDIFAVGAVAYELMTYEKAFNVTSKNPFSFFEEVKQKIVEQPHRPLTEARPGIDPELAAIIDRALAKNPDDRYQDLAEMRRHVRRIRERVQESLTEASSETTVTLTPATQAYVRAARQALDAGDPDAAVMQLEAALAASPIRPVRRFLERSLEHARDRQTAKRAEAVTTRAVADFQRGEHLQAMELLERFDPGTLVAGKLAELRRAHVLIQTAERAVEGSAAMRAASVYQLDQFVPQELTKAAADRLRARAAQLSAEEQRAREQARLENIKQVASSARDLFRDGRIEEAIAALDRVDEPADVEYERRRMHDAQVLVQQASIAAEGGSRVDRARTLQALADFADRYLVENVINRLREVDAVRRTAEDDQAAAAAVAAAVAEFESGGRGSALDALERFRPAHPRVDETRARLAQRDAELLAKEQSLKAAASATASARADFVRGRRAEAIAALAGFEPPELIAASLDELRRASDVIDRATAAVREGARAVRETAMAELTRFTPGDLVAAQARELAGLAAQRDAVERRDEEQAAVTRAEQAVHLARQAFQRGNRTEAMATLERFEDDSRVAKSLERLRAAAQAIEVASSTVGSRAPRDRAKALDRLSRFPDSELVAGALEDLRRLDRQRTAAEAHHAAAAAAIESARKQFDAGERAAALNRLAEFSPPHPDVTTALADLRERAAQLSAAESRQQEARELIAGAHAMFLEGRRDEAIQMVEAKRDWPGVAEASHVLRDAAEAIARVNQVVDRGDDGARSAALDELSKFQPPDLMVRPLELLRATADRRRKEERQLKEAEEAGRLEQAARAAVHQAEAAFSGGRRDEAIGILERFPKRELVSSRLETLQRLAALLSGTEDRIRTGSPADRQAALRGLSGVEPATLIKSAVTALLALDAERSAQEKQLEDEALAAREAELEQAALASEAEATTAQARQLFVDGDTDKANAVLENFRDQALVSRALDEIRSAAHEIGSARATVTTGAAVARRTAIERLARLTPADLFESTLAELRRLDAERSSKEAQQEAARLLAEANTAAEAARVAFVAGDYDSALSGLERFQPRASIEETLADLRIARQAIERARGIAAEGDDEAREQAIQELRAFEPADLAGKAVEQLQAAHIQRRAAETQERKDREILERAERTVGQAIQLFDTGDVDAALSLLDSFEPPLPIVTEVHEDLRRTLRYRVLLARAEDSLQRGQSADASAAVLEARRLRPEHPGGIELQQRIRRQRRDARMRWMRTAALGFALPGVLVAAIGSAGYKLWRDEKVPEGTSAGSPGSIPETAKPPVPTPTLPSTEPQPSSGASSERGVAGEDDRPATSRPDDETASIERQLRPIRQRANRQFAGGELRLALTTAERGLKVKGDDPELRTLLDRMAGRAATETANARAVAAGLEAPRVAAAKFREGVQREQRAGNDRSAGRLPNAVRELWAARDAFSEAAKQARIVAAATPSQIAGEPKPTNSPVNSRPPAAAPVPPVVEPPKIKPDPPKTSDVPAKTPSPAVRDETEAIRGVLRAYEAAFVAMDIDALQRVQILSAQQARSLRETFRQGRTFRLSVSIGKIDVSPDGLKATVVGQVDQTYTPKAGGGPLPRSSATTFGLEKRGDNWIIVSVKGS